MLLLGVTAWTEAFIRYFQKCTKEQRVGVAKAYTYLLEITFVYLQKQNHVNVRWAGQCTKIFWWLFLK